MKLVLVESPFMYAHGDVAERALGLLRNVSYARLALRDCLLRGEAPWCSHLVYTQPLVLDDGVPDERDLGIRTGLAWGARADLTAAYVDLGISGGMRFGLDEAARLGRPAESRRIAGWESVKGETPRETLLRLGLYAAGDLDRAASAGTLATFGLPPLDRALFREART